MMVPVTIDPRYHDAVIFGLDSIVPDMACIDAAAWTADGLPVIDSTAAFVRKLHHAGVPTGAYSLSRNREKVFTPPAFGEIFRVRVDGSESELGIPGKPDPATLVEAARRLGVRPGRCVVIDSSETGVIAGRDGGFGFVVGVDRMAHADDLRRSGADAVVADLSDVIVRCGNRRMSALPDALQSYRQIASVIAPRRPAVLFDFDGTLSAIVDDPDAATLVDGAAEALKALAHSVMSPYSAGGTWPT